MTILDATRQPLNEFFFEDIAKQHSVTTILKPDHEWILKEIGLDRAYSTTSKSAIAAAHAEVAASIQDEQGALVPVADPNNNAKVHNSDAVADPIKKAKHEKFDLAASRMKEATFANLDVAADHINIACFIKNRRRCSSHRENNG